MQFRFSKFRNIPIFLVSAFVGLTVSVSAQNSAVYINGIESGYIGQDTIATHHEIVWTVALRNTSGGTVQGHNNGFRIFSPSGAIWMPPVIDTLDIAPTTGSGWGDRMDGGVFLFQAVTGSASDTVAIGSYNIFGLGFENGFDANIVTITIPAPGIDSAFAGGTICLDSSFYGVTPWLWATEVGGVVPDWSGPHCYSIINYANSAPTIPTCPTSLQFSHCPTASYQYSAIDVDNDSPFVWTIISGPGEIDSLTGLWSYSPTISDVGALLNLEVAAKDPTGSNIYGFPCVTALNFTNVQQVFTAGCDTTLLVSFDSTASIDFDADPVDCDTLNYFISSVDSIPIGVYNIDSISGFFTFDPDSSDKGNLFTFTIGATDGIDTIYCSSVVEVTCCLGIRGDVNGDGTDMNILDLTFLVNFIFRGSGDPGPCLRESDINADSAGPNILDLTYIVNYVFRSGPQATSCL